MSSRREELAARQSELLRALTADGPVPDGFEAGDVEAAAGALLRKRTRAVAEAWPALAHSENAELERDFPAFAHSHPLPDWDGGYADGFGFLSALRRPLTEAVRAELAVARAGLVIRGGEVRPRRGPYLRGHLLRSPRRLLILVRVPGFGSGHLSLGYR